jgi:light-regulated signal transduction histidine kinase (bacteriophytochrome)
MRPLGETKLQLFNARAEVSQRAHKRMKCQCCAVSEVRRPSDRAAHGGHIFVESEVGKGTTFDIAIPVRR